jgi:serine/threonine protein kinase
MSSQLFHEPPDGCLTESALEKLAGGDIPEPALTFCLEHVCDCLACSELLDEKVQHVTFAERGAGAPQDLDDAVPVRFFDDWPAAASLPELEPPGDEDCLGHLGRYRVERVLGQSPMAVTWGAFEPDLNRPVAIKMLQPELAADPEVRSAFRREARAMAAIDHEGIVPVHLVDEFRGVPYFVMPLLEGESLQTRLEGGPLPAGTVARITRQLASALAAAHASGVVHRDVKPSNIWIRRRADGSEAAVLLDFGIAMPADAAGSASGTRGYRSPEQAIGAPCDARSDHFALGCVVFEMLTGRKAWPTGGDGPDLCRPLADPGLPARWRPLLRSLFSLDPSGRPGTLGEIERLLPSSAAGPSAAGLFASGAVLLAVLAGLCLATWKSGPGPVAPTDQEPIPPVAVTSPANVEPIVEKAPISPVPVTQPVNVSTDAGKIPILKAGRVFPGLISAQSSALGSVSPGGETVALLGEKNRIMLFSCSDGSEKGGFEAKPAPRALALSGQMVAIARTGLSVSIHDGATGLQAASFEADSAGPMTWAGTGADILLFRSKDGKLTAAKSKPNEPWKTLAAFVPVSKQWSGKSVVALSPQRGTDLVGALFSGQLLAIYDLKAARLVQASNMPALYSDSAPRTIAWRDSRTITVVADRKVTEHEIGRSAKDVALWELPASAQALVWLGPDEYAMVHDAGEKGMEVSLGRRAKRVFHAKLDTGGAWIERLEWIAASRTLAAYGRDGSVRLYAIPDRNKN